MVKKGDTLIEVTLAVGIFAMVAISIVAVMSGGTSSAQTALETTLAREEIDAQAEALRFIQASYITDKDIGEHTEEGKRYPELWRAITARAIDLDTVSDTSFLQYTPSTCAELYDGTNGEVWQDKAFIVDYRNLSSFTKDTLDSVLISSTDRSGAKNESKFTTATTYPRLVYSRAGTGSNTEADASLVADTSNYKFYRAEGIYIIAVRDNNTTTLNDSQTSAFYDFYIRTCWYGTDANQPSTISTVIRLYDPDAIIANRPNATPSNKNYLQNYDCNSLGSGEKTTLYDRRDNESYTVGKLADGQCWLLENLRLGTSHSINLSSSNSNVANSFNLPASSSNFTSYDAPAINTSSETTTISGGKVGAYYNYCAATAGTYCSNSGAGSGDASRDICPRGWRLPSISEYQNLRNAYGNDAAFISSLSAITSGEFQGTAAFQQNKGGYYWTSSYADGSNMRRLRITKSGVVDFGSSQNRSEGISVRCVRDD